jgi:hypothetical protein
MQLHMPTREVSHRLRILTPLILDSSDGDSAASPDAQFGEVERALEQLSGGERRRCALALAIAYAELAAHRGGLRSELLAKRKAARQPDLTYDVDGDGAVRDTER